jgi:photosystem II stability/assembly factor-like uncharacterized protein
MKPIGKYIVLLLLTILFCTGHSNAETDPSQKLFDWKKAYFFNFYSVCPITDGHVWVVGSNGVICALDPKNKKWTTQESGFAKNLYDVSFVDADNGWVVGQNGLILHTKNGGKSWTGQQSGVNEHLFGLCFVNPKDGWAVGAYGTIIHTEDGGGKWEFQGDQADRIYNDVCFVDSRNGWIIGEFGVILHTVDSGLTWVQQNNPLGEKTLFSISFKDSMNGFISGMDGAILETTDGGENWNLIESKTKENLFSVATKGEKQWAVGLKGTFTRVNASKWQEASEKIPTRAWLKCCAFIDEKSGWIVGSVGTVLHTTDGGESWISAGKIEQK